MTSERKTYAVTKVTTKHPDTREQIADFLSSNKNIDAKRLTSAASKYTKKLLKHLKRDKAKSTSLTLNMECVSTGKKYVCRVKHQKLAEPKTITYSSGPVTFEHSTSVTVEKHA